MPSFEEQTAKQFISTLLDLSSHIANISDEDTNIGSGIFILSIIDSHENCIMTNIVESLNLVPSTATRQVDSLVKQGLIKREVGKQDRRKVILSLTEEGDRVNKRFKNHVIEVIRKTLESYSAEEMNKSFQILDAIIDQSEKQLPLV
jgi:DNA-binding MarR family transcriptional regulator